MGLVFAISKDKYYRKSLGGSTHYLVQLFNEEDSLLKKEESLCDQINVDDYKIVNDLKNVNCKICNRVLEKLNSNE